MANICTTDIRLVMSDEKGERLTDFLFESSNLPVKKIYEAFGIKPNADTHLRATWNCYNKEYLDDGNVVLSVSEDAAWNATKLALQLKEEGLVERVYFFSEEPGCGIYATNDEEGVYFPNRYIVYIDDMDGDAYFETEKDALDYINQNCKKNYASLEDAVSENDSITLNTIEIVDEDDL